MFMRHLTAVLLLVMANSAYTVGGGGGGGISAPSPTTQPKTPEQISAGHYRAGVRHKERALREEKRAAESDRARTRERSLAKAQREYGKAIDRLGKAIQAQANNYEAANELGFVLRKTGDFNNALAAYDRALTIKADYYPAVEYRGEALLHLGRYSEAKVAYMILFNNDAELANVLMAAMNRWAEDNADAELSDDAQAFRDWVIKRRTLAQLTQAFTADAERTW